MKKRVLGLDTGTNSLGWAIVDKFDDGKCELVDKGVLIFQEGVKLEKGIESSKAAERTAHRSLRKQYFRRRLRKIETLKVLIRYNLCPALTEEDLKLWHTRKIYPKKDEFMQWQRTSDDEDINPYHDRYICLTEKLDLNKQEDRYHLGRAMYHLAQRRGFKSNRLDATEEDQSGKVKEGISDLAKDMQEAGCEYLGEYFYKLYHEKSYEVKIRSRYTDRESQYHKEFLAICRKQELPEEMQQELADAIYYQRPLKSQRQSVGKCTFEKGKHRCSDSHPVFEEFRILSFLNNVRIKTPYDFEFRPLNEEELAKIDKLFYRKSKPNFDFEEIAKAIAGRNNYCSKDEKNKKPYVFNYRMTQGVPGCPTTAQLIEIFGKDWKQGIAETYTLSQKKDGTQKSLDEMADDIWNVLYFFDDDEKLKAFAKEKLQLDDELAEKFVKIRLTRDFASLSLKAIRNILPFLRRGMLYSHSVFLAKVPDIVGKDITDDKLQELYDRIVYLCNNPESYDNGRAIPIDQSIKGMLENEYGVSHDKVEELYHPSMIETYPDAKPNHDGVVLLGSPKTDAVRNPMAMRSLHELRKVINQLILEGKIDPTTTVNIEYARELNDANKRYAINEWQRDQDKLHKKYADEIRTLYKETTGQDIEPTETDILKYQLWEEQNHRCIYTGDEIGISQFLGAGPLYDIEHTIPRSIGGDSTHENMTLCQSHYNRFVKKAQIPTQLVADYDGIMERIQPWKEKIDALSKQIDKLSHGRQPDKDSNDRRIRKKNRLKIERDYWQGKYNRFTMTEVPEGFARRQGAGIGLISRYAGLYLKSYFHDVMHPDRRQIFTVKGTTTADFRKMWGLQEEYKKKSRDSHTHHCIDAVIIACIGKRQYDMMAQYYHAEELWQNGKGEKPQFEKPWPTFTQDIQKMTDELIVVHETKDNMPKKASRKVQTMVGKVVAKGDCARTSLHNDTYYGAIEREGNIRYVVRRTLDNNFKLSDVENIVDDVVREKVRAAFEGNTLKTPVWMNKDKGVMIKKVRCYTPSIKAPLDIRKQRDISLKDYKQQYHVGNEENYAMAVYETGKSYTPFIILTALDAVSFLKKSSDKNKTASIVPTEYKGQHFRCLIKKGTQLILMEKDEDRNTVLNPQELCKRLFCVTKLEKDGRLTIVHNSEARMATELKKFMTANPYMINDDVRPIIHVSLSKFYFLVEGYDFKLNSIGEITMLK